MRENLQQVDYTREDRCGETPHPARKTRALPLNRLLLVGWLVVALNVCSTFTANAAEPSFKFAGVPFSPGSTVQANVPLSAQEKSFAGQGRNAVPQSAVAILATPANFDPRKKLPVLVAFSTRDSRRQNRDDLVDFYRRVGLAEGWVLLAGDGPQPAQNDTVAWRAAMTLAAIDALHHSFPGSEKWPMVCAGFSGGAKGASFIAPLLAKSGCHITGIYLTGANQEHLSEGYKSFQPGADFLTTPIFVSSGRDDRIATLDQQYAVVGLIKPNEPALSEFESGPSMAVMKSMTRKLLSPCAGSARCRNRRVAHASRVLAMASSPSRIFRNRVFVGGNSLLPARDANGVAYSSVPSFDGVLGENLSSDFTKLPGNGRTRSKMRAAKGFAVV